MTLSPLIRTPKRRIAREGIALGGPPPRDPRAGFSIAELIVALLILTVGLLGLAATTGHVIQTITAADQETERNAAVQSIIEELRASDYDQVASGSKTVGHYTVSWTVSTSTNSKGIQLVSVGPGLRWMEGGARFSATVADTTTYTILRP